jgi:hypothetical protein
VKRKDHQSAIWMLHLDVSGFAMNFNKAKTPKSGENLFA